MLGNQVSLTESRNELNDSDIIIEQVVEEYLNELEDVLVSEEANDDSKQGSAETISDDDDDHDGRSTATDEAVHDYLDGLEEIVLQ